MEMGAGSSELGRVAHELWKWEKIETCILQTQNNSIQVFCSKF